MFYLTNYNKINIRQKLKQQKKQVNKTNNIIYYLISIIPFQCNHVNVIIIIISGWPASF